jgi:hexokinase
VLQKLISGRYLGEILRLVICELIDEGVLFLGQNTYKIETPYGLDTAFLSLMERCPSDAFRIMTPWLITLPATRPRSSL